jgi:HK97 family phage major capsid protein
MATNSAFAVGDLFTAQQALQSRHQGNASWAMNLVHINDVREFGGTSYYTRSATLEADATGGTGAGRVLGKPVYESSDLSSTLDGDTNNNIVYGNFRNYVIADRIGVRTEFIPHLFATGNNRPSGQRGLYMHWRVGADSVNDNAFVLLYNPST